MSPESKALMDSETSWSRSARLVAVTMTSPRPATSVARPGFLLLRRGVAAGDRQDRRDGGRERARTHPRGMAIQVSHFLPSAVFLILATGRRPGNPPPVARRSVSTTQSMNSWVNVSMTADSGPGT